MIHFCPSSPFDLPECLTIIIVRVCVKTSPAEGQRPLQHGLWQMEVRVWGFCGVETGVQGFWGLRLTFSGWVQGGVQVKVRRFQGGLPGGVRGERGEGGSGGGEGEALGHSGYQTHMNRRCAIWKCRTG